MGEKATLTNTDTLAIALAYQKERADTAERWNEMLVLALRQRAMAHFALHMMLGEDLPRIHCHYCAVQDMDQIAVIIWGQTKEPG
jgi:hypothetical protein